MVESNTFQKSTCDAGATYTASQGFALQMQYIVLFLIANNTGGCNKEHSLVLGDSHSLMGFTLGHRLDS